MFHSEPSPGVQQDVLLDTYFARCHGKAYYILDESATRQRIQLGSIPTYLLFAIYAVSARWVEMTLEILTMLISIGIQHIQMDTMQRLG